MMKLTPGGLFVAAALAVAALCVPLWIMHKARRNGGVAELPSMLMFGWGGAAWGQTCIVVDSSTRNKAALIAHERCHQDQMALDGTLRFYWRYLTDISARQDYEIEAYRVWVKHTPADAYLCAHWLVQNYGLQLDLDSAVQLLTTDQT